MSMVNNGHAVQLLRLRRVSMTEGMNKSTMETKRARRDNDTYRSQRCDAMITLAATSLAEVVFPVVNVSFRVP